MGKLFTTLVANMMDRDAEARNLLGQMQHGFRKGWRSTDALFMLTQIIEMGNKAKKGIGLAFLGLRKA